MSTKRKHITLTIKDKHTIIERIDRGESQNKLAEEYGVGRATIYDIIKNRMKIQTFVSTIDSAQGNRQTLRKVDNPEVEEALYTWFLQESRKHTPITGPMLASKARAFYEKITGKKDFAASKGWLGRFKSRYGIRLMGGEKLANDSSRIEEFKARFLQKVIDSDLCPSQIYNATESVLCWRVLPNKTYVPREESSDLSRNVSEEIITFLPCANASGQHALKLLVIGKSQHPQAFKNIELPVHYFRQKSARMTREIFKKWFDEYFVPEVRKWLKEHNLPQKALLLLDNVPSHPCEEDLESEDKSITAMFIPSSCTSLNLPMDLNIIQFVKQNYKRNILLTTVSKDQCIERTLKEFNMKDMMYLLTNSWNLVSTSMIVSSWKDLWPGCNSILNSTEPLEDSDQDFIPLLLEDISRATQIPIEELQTWYDGTNEQEIALWNLSEEEILQSVTSIMKEEVDDLSVTVPNVSVEDAAKHFDICLQWAEENGSSCSDILLLRRMRDKALISRTQKLIQKKLDDYLVPNPDVLNWCSVNML